VQMQMLRFGICLTLVLTAVAAETVTLKDGRVIVGTYLGGSPSEVKLEVGDQIRTVNVARASRRWLRWRACRRWGASVGDESYEAD